MAEAFLQSDIQNIVYLISFGDFYLLIVWCYVTFMCFYTKSTWAKTESLAKD